MSDSTSVLQRIFDLGFYTEVSEEPAIDVMSTATLMYSYSELALLESTPQKMPKDLFWEIGCWLLLGIGVFLPEILFAARVTTIDVSRKGLRSAASIIIAFALFGPIMRWCNSKRRGRVLLATILPLVFGILIAAAAGVLAYASTWVVR